MRFNLTDSMAPAARFSIDLMVTICDIDVRITVSDAIMKELSVKRYTHRRVPVSSIYAKSEHDH